MRIARSTGAMSGLLIVLLGIWGGLIPFVGPYFNYAFGVNSTWHYTTDRLWLCILPGALAVIGGLLLFVAATRPAGLLGGWLALVAGAWFVIGPAVSLTWESGRGPIGAPLFGSTRQMFELIGYFYGLGAVIVALAAFAIGRLMPMRAIAAEAAPRAPAEPVARRPAAVGAETPAGREARGRLPFRRRSRVTAPRGEGTPVER